MKRRQVCVGVLIAGLQLSGCGGGGAPGRVTPGSAGGGVLPGPSSSTATSPLRATTTAASESAVVVPPEARTHTPDGAKAFAGFYMELISDAYVSFSVSSIEALSSSGCTGCRVLSGSVAKAKQRGRRALSRSLTVDMTQLKEDLADGTSRVEVAGTERAVSLVDATGAVVGATSSGRVTFLADVKWTLHGWRMSDVKLVTP